MNEKVVPTIITLLITFGVFSTMLNNYAKTEEPNNLVWFISSSVIFGIGGLLLHEIHSD
jgi:hypothetical protein